MLSISFILIMSISIFIQTHGQLTCASGWEENEGKCYLINPAFNAGSRSGTWVQCNAYCSTSYSNATMFCVDKQAVNLWLTTKYSGYIFFIGYTVIPPYGGGTYTNQFGWITGCSSTYTNWDNGEPGASTDEYYTAIRSNAKWHDFEVISLFQCGCQYTPGLTNAPTFSPSSSPSTVAPTTSSPSTAVDVSE